MDVANDFLVLNACVHHAMKRQSSLAVRSIRWRMAVCGISGTDSQSGQVKSLNLLLTTKLDEQTLKFCKLVSQFHTGNCIERYILGMEKGGRGKSREVVEG